MSESLTSMMKRNHRDDSPLYKNSLIESLHAPKRPKYQNGKHVDLTKQYYIFGDFSLPHPTTINLPDFQRDLALEWEQAFRDFSERDFLAIQKPVDFDEVFEKFRAQEKETWKQIDEEPGVNEHLIKPSGNLDSPLAHHLHQPSMETNNLRNGETADYSNGCLRMLMNNGYKQGNLVFDHLHRRSRKSNGLQIYPKEILHYHEEWTRRIYQAMTSPIVLLYGQHVQKRVLHNLKLGHTIFPLWGRARGQVLVIFDEQSFTNADPRYKIRRIGIFAYHPQRFFYEKPDSLIAQNQDQTFAIVNEMLLNTIPVEEGYYTKKKWLRHNLTMLKAFRQIDLDTPSNIISSPDMLSLPTQRYRDSATQAELAEGSTMMVLLGSPSINIHIVSEL